MELHVTETVNEGLTREYKIKIPAKEMLSKVDNRLQQLAKTVKAPGFRPGKVPSSVVKRQHGKEVLAEVLEQTINETSQKTLNDRGLRAALQPKIEITSFDDGADLHYTMAVEIFPEVPALDIGKITLERVTPEVEDAQLNDALDRLADSNKRFVEPAKARAAKLGDAVVIDFVGKVDGVAFEGGTAQDFQLELGSKSFIDTFEDQLVGAKAGEEVLVKVTFPEQYHKSDLAGQKSTFDVTVKKILEATKPEIDEEFAKSLGEADLETLKKDIRAMLENQFKQVAFNHTKKALFDLLEDQYDFTIPAGMVKLEFDSIWSRAKAEKEQNPEFSEKSEEELEQDYRDMAERRVRLGILLAETGRKNNIEVTNEELRQAIMQQARMFPGQENQVIQFYRNNPNQVEFLKGPILEDKVVNYILEKATVTEKTMKAGDLLKEMEAAESDSTPKKKKKKKA